MAKKADFVLSHWYHLLEGLQDSPQQFYAAVEEAVKRRQLTDVSLSRIDYYEGAPLVSHKRIYLRVKRKEHIFDICAAPFGNSFFVSWWLGERLGLLYRIPIFGLLFLFLFRPSTYFRLDTALMFQESVHSAVLEILDGIAKAKGLRSLSELERKPTLSDVFSKKR